MDDLGRRINENLLAVTPEWQSRAAGMKEVVMNMYEQKRKRAAMWSWAGTAVGIGLMFLGICALVTGIAIDSTIAAVVGAMMFLFGDGWMGLSKLLYWIWQGRLQLERDLKEVHFDVLELHKKLEQMEAAIAGRPAPEA